MRFFDIGDLRKIDLNALWKQLPVRGRWNPFSTQAEYIGAILRSGDVLKRNGIDNALRLAHFLGQGLVETNYLSAKGENLNYRFETLKRLFGHKFKDDDEIRAYAGKPEKIANRIYANRMGNGPEESGDGWKYRGRGFFQLTGKNNYRKFGEMAGVDLLSDPDQLTRSLKRSVQVAAAYFNKAGLGEFADRNDVAAVSRGINRGNPHASTPAFHEAERIDWTGRALDLIRNYQGVLLGDGEENEGLEDTDGKLGIGSRGADVREVQRLLNALGYNVGPVDGIFGPGTSRMVRAFQFEHGLEETGVVDVGTLEAMREALDAPRASPASPTPTEEEERDRKNGNAIGGAAAGAGTVAAGAAANEAGVVEDVIDIVRGDGGEEEAAVAEEPAPEEDAPAAPTPEPEPAPEAEAEAPLPPIMPEDDLPEAPEASPADDAEGGEPTAPEAEADVPGEAPTAEEAEDAQVSDEAPEPIEEPSAQVEVPSAPPPDTTPQSQGPEWWVIGLLIVFALIFFFIMMKSRGVGRR